MRSGCRSLPPDPAQSSRGGKLEASTRAVPRWVKRFGSAPGIIASAMSIA